MKMNTKNEMLADAVKCLRSWNMREAGELNGATVLARPFPHNDFWTVCDNGGEFNVHKINSAELTVSVPYTHFGTVLDAATMAYRIACAIRGNAIDYDYRLDDMLDYLKKAA